MKNIFKIVVIALSCITFGVAQNKKQDGIFAEFNTTKGKIVVEFDKQSVQFIKVIAENNGIIADENLAQVQTVGYL